MSYSWIVSTPPADSALYSVQVFNLLLQFSIGKRIAHRRKSLGLKQSEVEERAEIGYKYLSSIERGLSIPSIEVVMRLAAALDTTPDTFLVGSARQETARWESVAQYLRLLDEKQLDTAESFLAWLSEQG